MTVSSSVCGERQLCRRLPFSLTSSNKSGLVDPTVSIITTYLVPPLNLSQWVGKHGHHPPATTLRYGVAAMLSVAYTVLGWASCGR